MKCSLSHSFALVGVIIGLSSGTQNSTNAATHESHAAHHDHSDSKAQRDNQPSKKSSPEGSTSSSVDPKYKAYSKPMKVFPFAVDSTSGQKVNQETLKGRWSLITFGFTACGDVCPLTMARLKRELNKFSSESSDKIDVYFATLDPDTDKPNVLDKYLKSWKIKFPITGLVGSREVMHKLAKQFAPVSEKKVSTAVETSKPEIIHTGIIFVVNPRGELEGYFSEAGTGEKIASGMQKLMRS